MKEFIIPTSELIKDYMEHFSVTKEDLSIKTGVSQTKIDKILNDKIRLDPELADKIAKVFEGLNVDYLLNYDQKYKEYLDEIDVVIDFEEDELKKISEKFKFSQVFKGLGWSLKKQAYEMLKILDINNYKEFKHAFSNLNVNFMEDGGDKEAIAVWLKLCEEEIEFQNNIKAGVEFSLPKLEENLLKFKKIANNGDLDSSLKSAKKLCNKLGINLVFKEAIVNSKVRGALVSYEGIPTIYLSDRFKRHDYLWFALMHEIGHLLLHYEKDKSLITVEDENCNIIEVDKKEFEANEFAREFFIKKVDYLSFVKQKKFTKESILRFTFEIGIQPGILISRLQRDRYIGYDKFNYLRS